jgi:hypothetical protein
MRDADGERLDGADHAVERLDGDGGFALPAGQAAGARGFGPMTALRRLTAVSARLRRPWPVASRHSMRPFPATAWMWRSRLRGPFFNSRMRPARRGPS